MGLRHDFDLKEDNRFTFKKHIEHLLVNQIQAASSGYRCHSHIPQYDFAQSQQPG